jgi:hypothetical protein
MQIMLIESTQLMQHPWVPCFPLTTIHKNGHISEVHIRLIGQHFSFIMWQWIGQWHKWASCSECCYTGKRNVDSSRPAWSHVWKKMSTMSIPCAPTAWLIARGWLSSRTSSLWKHLKLPWFVNRWQKQWLHPGTINAWIGRSFRNIFKKAAENSCFPCKDKGKQMSDDADKYSSVQLNMHLTP